MNIRRGGTPDRCLDSDRQRGRALRPLDTWATSDLVPLNVIDTRLFIANRVFTRTLIGALFALIVFGRHSGYESLLPASISTHFPTVAAHPLLVRRQRWRGKVGICYGGPYP